MLIRKTQVLARAEGENGTYIEPASTAGILAYDVVATPEFKLFKRDPEHSDLSRYASLSGQQTATINFKVELRGDGASTNPPANVQLLLEACNFSLSSGAMTPKSTAVTTISLRIEEDGVYKKFRGCAGNVRITGNVGEPVFLDFSFKGTIEDILAGNLTSLTGLPTTVPPVLLSALFATNVGSSISPVINSIEFDMQNEVTLRANVNGATGVLAGEIVGRNPVGSMDPEYSTSYDWIAQIITNVEGTLTITLGSVTYNKMSITAPKIRFLAMDPADRDGVRILTVPFEMNRSSGNDEISISWNI